MKVRTLPRFVRISFRLIIVAALIFASFRWFNDHEPIAYSNTVMAVDLLKMANNERSASYTQLAQSMNQEQTNASPSSITFEPVNYKQASSDAELTKSEEDGRQVLSWTNELGWVEWTFHVKESGLYELQLDYKALPGSTSSVIRGVMLDGKYPFQESERLELERMWKDAKYPYDRNEIGMQIRPQQTELVEWQVKALRDLSAASRPLLYQLESGDHTLRITGEKGTFALRAMSFQTQELLPTYEEYVKTQPARTAQPDWFELIEAEQFERKSSLSIQTDHWSEPYISPDPKGRITYNVLGGNRWKSPGEWVEWKFVVPADGWYEIDLKNYQNYRPGFKAYRTIEIDGVIPFQELQHYSIPFHKEFLIDSIADLKGNPYQFYLKQGEHQIRMIADSSVMQPILIALKDTLSKIADLDRHVRLITGNYSKNTSDANMDATRTWDMRKFDPDVDAKLNQLEDQFSQIRDYIHLVNERDSDLAQAITTAMSILQAMQEDVNEIPNRVNDFSTIQANIGTWMSTLTRQQLLLDYMVVRTSDTKTGLKEPNGLSRVPYSITDFARSFYMNYDVSEKKDGALTLWVGRGRDYVDQLRELVNQDFTPKTGIQVNINLMPNPNMLILGNAAGEVPDVALGVGEALPSDYAMRNAVEDISKYPDYNEVIKRFIPGATQALFYNGGTYGLPEVQNFQLLFYRTDIFEQLGLKVPDTWEDVFDILPTLQENGMTMNYPKADFSTLFLEHGASPYSADGLKANLFGDSGQKAFKTWTELFTKYNLPIDIPAFFQHFRDGDIPIGVADFNTYVQLQVAAPEITGHWKVAPLPGIKQLSGEVARWSPQGLTTAMIMKKSNKKDDAWTFLKWWTSGEVQSQYAKDMESYYGIEYRWNTANVEAMKTLSWPSEDLIAIREQARWANNLPIVPGYYFLSREMDFAWNKTVFDKIPASETLEAANVSLQREMDRRQRNFGISGKSLQVPIVTEPFNWEDVKS